MVEITNHEIIQRKKNIRIMLADLSVEDSSELTDFMIKLHNEKVRERNAQAKMQFEVGDKVIVKSQRNEHFEAIVEKIMQKNIRVQRQNPIQMWDVSPTLLEKVEGV